MSFYSLPIILLNLGGEMFYVLEQRLRAQKVPTDRAQKVLNEIAAVMLNERFLEEMFKPQQIYNKQELYLLFRDIAHASIMKLNDLSMGKLYDLMIMVFKYQLYFASQPRDVLLVTLNHLDSLRNLVSSQQVHKQLDNAYYLLMKTYYPMTDNDLQFIRYDLLNYLQDIHIKVSIFLRLGQQNNDGTFVNSMDEYVPNGIDVPGTVKVFHRDGSIKDVVTFPATEYTIVREEPVLDIRGKRVTELGRSIYQNRSALQDFSWSYEENLESHILKNSDGSNAYCSEIKTLMTQLLVEKGDDEDEEEMPIDLFTTMSGIKKNVSDTQVTPVKTINLNDLIVRQDVKLQNAAQEINVDVENCNSNDLLYLLENTE